MSDEPNKVKQHRSGGGFKLFLWSVVVIAVVLTAAVAWHVRPRTSSFLTDGDTIRQSARTAPIRDVLWQPPVPLGEVVNTTDEDYEPRISWDGMTLYFVRGRAGANADIYQSKRTPSGWTDPEPLALINTEHDELGPEPSADGRSLYFYSDRPGGCGGYDLWVLRFDEDGHTPLGEPANLSAKVNSPYNDYGPTIDPAGKTILFASNRPPREEAAATDRDAWPATVREDLAHRSYDLYAAPITDAGHGVAHALDALNTPYNDGPPAFSPIGDFLYFASDRPGGQGAFDLYRARRTDGVFEPPRNLGPPVNTPANELDPGLTQLGYALYFSSDRRTLPADADAEPPKDYNLYYSSSREVFRDSEITRATIDWSGIWGAVGPNLLLALLALLLLLLLLRLMRGVQGRRLSLLARCLLASLVAHILLMLLLNVWQVTSSVAGLLGGDKDKIRITMTSATQGDAITAQVLGSLTDVDHPAYESPSSERLESQLSPSDTAAFDPSRTIELARAPIEIAADVSLDPKIVEANPPEESEPTFEPPLIDKPDAARAVALLTPADLLPVAQPEPLRQDPEPAPTLSATRPVVDRPEQPPQQLVETDLASAPIESLLNLQDARKLVSIVETRESKPQQAPITPPATAPGPPTELGVDTQFDLPAVSARQTQSESAPAGVKARMVQSRRDASSIRLEQDHEQALQVHTTPPDASSPRIPDARFVTTIDTPLTDAAVADSIAPPADTSSALPSTGSFALPNLEASQRHAVSESSPTVQAEDQRAARMAPAAPDDLSRSVAELREIRPQSVDVALDDRRLVSADATDWKDAKPLALAPTKFETPADVQADVWNTDAFALPTLEEPVADDQAPEETAERPIPVELGRRALMDSVPRGAIDRAQPAASTRSALRDVQPVNAPTSIDATSLASPIDEQLAEASPAPATTIVPPVQAVVPSSDRMSLPTLEVASGSPSQDAPDAERSHPVTPSPVPSPRRDLVDAPPVESVRVALAPSATPSPESWDRIMLDPTDAVHESLRSVHDPSPSVPAPLMRSQFDPGALNLTLPVESIPPDNPYVQRSEEARQALLDRLGGSPETEAAVAGALRWLANHQSADGRWDADGFDAGCGQCGGETKLRADVALTGLSLLCFLGANHTPDRDGPYRENVQRALDWLLDHQEDDGNLRQGESLYSQGVATIAIAEAAGMTGDPALLDPVERAADYIARARNKRQGGWRYEPGQAGDTSSLGWQVMAFRSARHAGASVNPIGFAVARDWLEQVSTEDHPGLYAYQPGDRPTLSMTAEGMFIQQMLGRSPEEPRMRESAAFLRGALPAWASNQSSYYWYYGTLAAFQHQGELWSRWNPAIKRELLNHQNRQGTRAGSWDPKDRYSLLGGRVYQTALCTLMLEVYYRYLPMYGPEAPADAIGQIRGRVTDATSGRPILGASVKLDLPDREPLIASAGRAGNYTLFPPQMPDFFALSAWAQGYVPKSINVPSSRLEGNVLEIDFDLEPADKRVIAIEAFPTVHHIGNNRWEGRINSQFQKEAEGEMYEATFEVAADQRSPHFSGAAVALLAKGVQCPPRIWINGRRIDHHLDESPSDGSFGDYVLRFDIDEMQEGENRLRIRSTTCRGDLDDWEFVNVQIRLSP